jgi:hypothetical protein
VDDGALPLTGPTIPPPVRRIGPALEKIRARPGVAAIVCLGIAWGMLMHAMGWAQLAHFAQVRALADGQAEIDRWHWETNDKAWVDGHFYSVKSPGLAALSTPFYVAIDKAGGPALAREAADNARRTPSPRWAPHALMPLENYGFDIDRAAAIEYRTEGNAPIVWALTLIGAVIPAVLLLLGVRWAADRIEPGYGTAAAVNLGLGTILMTFASEYFSHVIAAALGFAAFLLLMRERSGPPSIRAVAAAGLLAGLAITFEYQLGLVAIVLLFYAAARSSERLRRAAVYGAGALCGVLPLIAFNLWAFGDPLKLAYSSAVDVPGLSGHDVLGLNSEGFFGITAPRADSAVDLLFASRGLLVVTPIIACCVAGVVLMRRRHRAEGNVIAAVALLYFLYNMGYWLPFGGGTPGPRFLIPALPFLALGLATAYRRFPAVTLGLAIPSAVFMLAGALTFPLIGDNGTGIWADYFYDGALEHTLLTVIGVSNPYLGAAPVLAAVVTAIILAARATPRRPLGDVWPAVALVLTWALISVVGPSVAGSPITPLDDNGWSALWLVALGVVLSLATLAAIRLREQPQPLAEAALAPEPALGERSS